MYDKLGDGEDLTAQSTWYIHSSIWFQELHLMDRDVVLIAISTSLLEPPSEKKKTLARWTSTLERLQGEY